MFDGLSSTDRRTISGCLRISDVCGEFCVLRGTTTTVAPVCTLNPKARAGQAGADAKYSKAGCACCPVVSAREARREGERARLGETERD